MDLNKAKEIILGGGVVGIPTETVYGLAASIESEEGIRKIFTLKQRPFFDPLIVHISDLKQLDQITTNISENVIEFAKLFWPGPLTLILPKNKNLNPLITSGLDTVAVRMPSHPIALKLLEEVNVPLAAPSANKFGKTSPTKAEHVRSEWPNDEVSVIEGGECSIGIESTVMQILENGDSLILEIYRPGFILESDLRAAANKLGKKAIIKKVESEKSPGHLPYHYQPEIPLVISKKRELSEDDLSLIKSKLNLKSMISVLLELNSDSVIAARELYSKLRELSKMEADFILLNARELPKEGLWQAIWDRLNRAASFQL